MNLKTKIICIVLAAVILIGGGVAAIIVIAMKKPNVTVLSAPENVSVSASGTVVWDKVENAEYYHVFLNGKDSAEVKENKYKLTDLSVDYRIKVKAYAGSVESDFSAEAEYKAKVIKPAFDISVSVKSDGKKTDSVKAGKTAELEAVITSDSEASEEVEWEIVQGEDAIENILKDGNKLSLKSKADVSGNKLVTVRASSKSDRSVYTEACFTVNAKTVLTDEMLAAVGNSKVLSFDGYILLDVYNLVTGNKAGLYSSSSVTIRTAMSEKSGENNWYAEYENASLGIKQSIYCKKHDGKACEVSINFKNEENYSVMKDESGKDVLWEDSGYYNNFKGLKKSDFEFNDQAWRWRLRSGTDGAKKLISKMIASANPYDFLIDDDTSFELIIDENEYGEPEIIGICAVAGDDYSIVSGKATVQSLFVSLDVGENVKVPTIQAYESVDDYKDADKKQAYLHLREAIANMKALNSYKTSFVNTSAMLGQSYTSVTGYEEIVTDDVYYFRPYSTTTDGDYVFTDEKSYGYRKVAEGKYNAFNYAEDEKNSGYYYTASRAYEGAFSEARASFDFAAEIFAAYSYDEDSGITVFGTEDLLSNVATAFYRGVGNDVNLYGLFAQMGNVNGVVFPTNVGIELINGKYYITSAAFYYNILSYGMYGVVDIEYSDFDKAVIDESTLKLIGETKVREIPSKWSDVTVIEQNGDDDVEIVADVYLKKFFGAGSKSPELTGCTVEEIPFIGNAIGDTYGFGMAQSFVAGNGERVRSIKLYYDVPLGLDYTIDESLEKIYAFLKENGYKSDSNGEYRKDGCNLVIKPADESLDLFVYLWTE